jgi:predicted methyltransferase
MNTIPGEDELFEKIDNAYLTLHELRGIPDEEFDQYFVSKKSSIERALIKNPEEYTGKRIMFLGDMDLTSLPIGIISKPKDLAVIDIDKRIPEIVFNMKTRQRIRSIRYINHDIRVRMIIILKNQFDYIFLEPPMTEEGLEVGLTRAVQCANKESSSRIFLSFDIQEDKIDVLDKFIDIMNLEIEEKKSDFNKYEYETPLKKKTSDLYIIKVKPNSKETIPNHYFGPLYFRESNEQLQPYKCKCGHIYKIGSKGDFSFITELEKASCSKCNYSGPFLYNSSIAIE